MRYGEAIKKGFEIINRNWQLILVQVGAMFLSFIGFLIVVGIPLAITFIIFGLDLTELSNIRDMLSTFHNPSEIISKYFGLVLFVIASILFYILVVMCLGVFVFGGSIGMISRAIKEEGAEFRMKVFLSEGKRLFFPLIGFTAIVGLIFIILAFILGLFGGAIAAITSIAREYEATLALFIGIFFSLILFVVGSLLILGTLAITLYGTAVLAQERSGPFKAIKESIRFLSVNAPAFYLYCIVFGGYVLISIMLILAGSPVRYIPFIGPLLTALFQFSVHIVQSYLGLVMLATIFWCYSFRKGAAGVAREAGSAEETAPVPIAEGSTQENGTAAPQDAGHDDIPPEKEAKE